MFKSNSNSTSPMKKSDNNSPDQLNRIVEGTHIEGDIKSQGNIRIDGEVKGTIQTKGRLVIGPTGKVEGEIVCENGDIEGTFVGKINVKQLLSLKATSKLSGDIITDKLSIESGSDFIGSCSMGKSQQTVSKPPASNKMNKEAAPQQAVG